MSRRELSQPQLDVVTAIRPWLEAACQVRVGCSGGADSMALAVAVHHLATRDGSDVAVEAVVVDHGLQAGSDVVAARTVEQLAARGMAARVVPVTVAETGAGPEADARAARLGALTDGFDGDVWLAHTMDDQAESVLLGLARGSGTRSLAGMAACTTMGRARLIRPLLGLRRAVVRQAAIDWGVQIWDDPQNSDPRFLRVRVREQILPMLERELDPGIVPALARTAALARADADALDALAERFEASGASLNIAELVELDEAVRSRVLRSWLQANRVESPSAAHVEAITALVLDWHGQRGVDLPGGWRVVRSQGDLSLRAEGR